MHPLVEVARRYLHKREGDPAMPFATGARPWCARFLVEVARECGVFIPADEGIEWSVERLLRHLGARGHSLDHRTKPFLPGDIIAKRREGGMHVGIVTWDGGGDVLWYLSGNSSRKGRRGVVWVAENPIARAKITNAARVVA